MTEEESRNYNGTTLQHEAVALEKALLRVAELETVLKKTNERWNKALRRIEELEKLSPKRIVNPFPGDHMDGGCP